MNKTNGTASKTFFRPEEWKRTNRHLRHFSRNLCNYTPILIHLVYQFNTFYHFNVSILLKDISKLKIVFFCPVLISKTVTISVTYLAPPIYVLCRFSPSGFWLYFRFNVLFFFLWYEHNFYLVPEGLFLISISQFTG